MHFDQTSLLDIRAGNIGSRAAHLAGCRTGATTSPFSFMTCDTSMSTQRLSCLGRRTCNA